MREIRKDDRVRDMFAYDPETGDLIWKIKKAGISFGSIAGCRDKKFGYIRVRVNGQAILAHRIIWFLMTGEWPEYEVDHKDRNPSNNSWENLRQATRSENMHNAYSASVENSLGIPGVYVFGKRFASKIQVLGKSLHLGVFDTPEEAGIAYAQAKSVHVGNVGDSYVSPISNVVSASEIWKDFEDFVKESK